MLQTKTRQKTRRLAVGLSGLTAVLYLLIGLNLVTIENTITDSEQQTFGLTAAAVFAAGAVVAAVWDRRWLWVVGAIGLSLIVLMYVNIAAEREPQFELWGILIRLVQLPLLGTLVLLATTTRQRAPIDPRSLERHDHHEVERAARTPSPPPPTFTNTHRSDLSG